MSPGARGGTPVVAPRPCPANGVAQTHHHHYLYLYCNYIHFHLHLSRLSSHHCTMAYHLAASLDLRRPRRGRHFKKRIERLADYSDGEY